MTVSRSDKTGSMSSSASSSADVQKISPWTKRSYAGAETPAERRREPRAKGRQDSSAGRPLLEAEDRIRAILNAPEETLACVDQALEGWGPNHPPLLLRGHEAAKMLGVSAATFWRIVQDGKLERIPLRPGAYRFRRSDVERLAKGEVRV